MVASLELLLAAAAAALVVPLSAQASSFDRRADGPSRLFDDAAVQRRALDDRRIRKRATTTDAAQLAGQAFDYVIVGGGTAGLAVASRLSENSSLSIAVIEAGTDGSAVEDEVLAPAMAYFGGIANVDSIYDWQYVTEPQDGLDGRGVFWPRGKILGGSSAVNGLYMIRQSQIEQDSWASLNSDNSTWTWDALYPYMKKSELWTPPNATMIDEAGMVLDESLHGLEGPVHYSYPGFFYPSTNEWIPTLAALGIDSRDPAGGENWGAFIATSAINPTNWTRSYAKNGYLDPINYRTNLVVLTGFQATKIVFDGTTATGVEFSAGAGNETYTVSASQEVILSAGVIGSPQLLQVSGVGPADLLEDLGITVVKDLPGVGMHLTDHLSGAITLNTSFAYSGDPMETNDTFAAEQLALWKAGDPSSLYTAPNDAVAYINLTTLMGSETAAQQFIDELAANQSAQVEAYSSNEFVQKGYNSSYTAELRDIYPSAVGQAEILLSATGTYGGYGDSVTIQIQAAIQHPLSRGSVLINSTSTFDKPVIDAGYLTHPGDVQILRQAFKYARTISQTPPFSDYVLSELAPGDAVQTDEEWETWLRGRVSTEYHAASTCSLLPEEDGGVVDTSTRVYGITGLRVIDASIIPISFSAHATAPTYGVAERAYDLLLSVPRGQGGSAVQTEDAAQSSASSTGTSSTKSDSPTSTGTSNAAAQSDNPSGARALSPASALATLLAAVGAFFAFA
ncbi:GMC oxidoreductase [Rhodotorula diobovata]|uniref:GMC oxidoreductase n=1 Tax=Rhodotorula diobovata TaxID=5288 RepID=A0A5C5G1W0_9BASI|nr:GMC oxidoreductase [Rhodotorula diobovata]